MKPEKCIVIILPSDFTHTHRGMPSFKTEKEIVTVDILIVIKENR